MNILRVGATVVIFGLALTACGPSETPQQQRVDREITALAPLKANSQDLITGFDVKDDTTLIVSIDLDQWTTTDDSDTAALEASALKRWRAAWLSEHAGQHALLHVTFVDYHGAKAYAERVKA